MNPYVLLPLFSCIACSMVAVAILSRDPAHKANRVGAACTLSTAFWALCEVIWGISDDPVIAAAVIRASAFGWVSVGPIALHLFLILTGHPAQHNRRLLGSMYAGMAVLIGIDCTTDWTHTSIERTAWGWGYHVGPVFGIAFLYTTTTLMAGVSMLLRDFRQSISAGQRRQAYLLFGATLLPLLIASVTDGVLPILGVLAPRYGVASLTLLIGTIAWSFYHYGYSLFAPGAFASEILTTLVDGVALLRADGRIHTANPGMARLAGCSVDGLLDMRFESLVRGATIDPLEEFDGRECDLRDGDGAAVPVSLSSSVLRDKRGHPIGLVVVAKDLREVTSLRSRLVASDRLAAVGQLAAGIAHEINNPVTYVRANLGALRDTIEVLGKELPSDTPPVVLRELDDAAELVAESLDGVDRVVSIVRNVKGFSHAGTDVHRDVDLHEVLDTVLRVAMPQIPSGLRVDRRYGSIPVVRGVPQQLEQVFLNLLINAIHAVKPGDPVWVETGVKADRVVVTVADEGCGMQPEVLERVFDPFFTTKRVGDGTGLGLSISYEIIRSHGGELAVESQPGRGTRFRVSLPRH